MADWREITAEWMGGMDFKTAGTNGVELVMGIAGEKTGVSPVEMLLMAKAGCTGMDIVSILQKKRQPPKEFKVKVRGVRAEQHPRVYEQIEVEYLVWGDVEPAALEQAIRLSEDKYCSVGVMLSKAVEIRSSYHIYPAAESERASA